MRLAETIAGLKTMREGAVPGGGTDRLRDIEGLAGNPGNLRARCHVPADLPPGAPLVVVLHGCTQNAAAYDSGSGWSTLADRHGFATLFPEQRRANNANLCFNWFEPGDTARGGGEAASIASMVEKMVRDHGIDRARIFVTGLSAGGAMTSVMLATYPELFAGGAIIAGLAYGSASNVSEAMTRMGGRGLGEGDALGGHVRQASSHAGPWPRVSVWQGSADHVVAPVNADAILAQWTAIHRVAAPPVSTSIAPGHAHSVWRDAGGTPVIEHHRIAGLGHGTPLAAGKGEGQLGAAGPHMLDIGISSTEHIAAFFGIAPAVKAPRLRRDPTPPQARPIPRQPRRAERIIPAAAPAAAPSSGVQQVIEDALKAAGLMR